MTLFINNGGPVKIRIGEPSDCNWATIRNGEKIDLTPKEGRERGFSEIKTTKGQIGNKIVETKQIESNEDFLRELCSIKGIGRKTAEDIIRIFPKSEDLKKHIQKMEKLPLRDDIEELLMEAYK